MMHCSHLQPHNKRGHLNRISKVALALTLVSACVSPALAAWPNQSALNLPVCTAAGNQNYVATISDGAGGTIVTWADARGGNWDIYAQHVLASGAVDPTWPINGRAVCTAFASQSEPIIIGDGAGGALIAWLDLRGVTTYDIYAQHVLASGTVDPTWPVKGRALCTAEGDQNSPTIVTDGAGGAIVTWSDLRVPGNDIYAQRVLASGVVDPAWPVDGLALCTAANSQYKPTSVSDGAGGAIVSWGDGRSGYTYDICAQRVLATGTVDPAWPLDGRALSNAASHPYSTVTVTDGAGGAIVAWQIFRNGNPDIYAQHVGITGAVDPAWPVDGRGLCTAAGSQYRPTIVSDGAGGAITTWYDQRSGTNDVYAQRVLASGIADPAWPVNGRALCTAVGDQLNATIDTDGAGGAIVSWTDLRSGSFNDIYAQRVLATGTVDPAWPLDGRALSTAANNQTTPVIVTDGAGGAVVTWVDNRGGSTTDIYAQRVARHGYLGTPEAELAGVKDIPNDNGGRVKVSWNASYLDLAQDANLAAYDILRSVPPNTAALRLARGERAATSMAELAEAPGADRMLVLPQAAQGYYWELLGSVAALHYVSGYGYIAATLGDSIGAGNPRTAFMVVARNASGSMFWPSRPDSGYSVDNLPPAAPAPFAANYAAGTTYLHWDRNAEVDLAGYRLYRGASPSFTPSPATLIAALPDTGYADPASATYTYKLTAIDVHGNESLVATITPTGITGVGDGPAVRELALAPASPNPAARGTTLRFALPHGARVSLGIHDAAGRLVRSLANGPLAAGEHAAEWDLRDGTGRTVGAGLYFARLEVGGRVLTRRIAVTR